LGSSTAGDSVTETRRSPGVEAAGQVGDVAEAGTPQNTRGDRASIAAFAMHHKKFLAVPVRPISILAFRVMRDEFSIAPLSTSPNSRTSIVA
jgi:hypothetical protein